MTKAELKCLHGIPRALRNRLRRVTSRLREPINGRAWRVPQAATDFTDGIAGAAHPVAGEVLAPDPDHLKGRSRRIDYRCRPVPELISTTLDLVNRRFPALLCAQGAVRRQFQKAKTYVDMAVLQMSSPRSAEDTLKSANGDAGMSTKSTSQPLLSAAWPRLRPLGLESATSTSHGLVPCSVRPAMEGKLSSFWFHD